MTTRKPIKQLLHDYWQKKSAVFLSSSMIPALFQSRILGIGDGLITITNTVPPTHITQFLAAGQFTLTVGLSRFSSAQISGDGVNLVFNIDEMAEIHDARQDVRIPFETHENVLLEIKNPYDNETLLRKPIIEMSSAGLSIKTGWRSQLFLPGTEFSGLRILIDGNLYQKADGKVVYQRIFYDIQRNMFHQVGFQLSA